MSVGVAKPPRTGRTAESVWTQEKPRLLKSHRGWLVAYKGRRQVALEPTLDRLLAALDEKLGAPRKPCQVHHIVEAPLRRRGPSPRLHKSSLAGK